jgi:hypothetical protein
LMCPSCHHFRDRRCVRFVLFLCAACLALRGRRPLLAQSGRAEMSEDVAPNGYVVDRATVRQMTTGRPVKFELTDQTREGGTPDGRTRPGSAHPCTGPGAATRTPREPSLRYRGQAELKYGSSRPVRCSP